MNKLYLTIALRLSACILVSVFQNGSASADSRPNIVVIMVDDMGFSDLGCYGSEIQTPNLDQLARNGVRYTQMYNTSKCWTTRISLLTGQYHHRTGRAFANTAMAGEVLRPAGYHTWWSGKHHADFNPYERGFDHFSGFLGGAINFWNPGDRAREGEPEPGWRAVYNWAFDEKIVKPFVPQKGFHATDAFTDWSLNWLDEAKNSGGGIDKPFFLYLAYNAPHWPLHAHPKDIAKYKGVYDRGYSVIRKERYERQVSMGLFDRKSAPLTEPSAPLETWEQLSDQEKHKESMRMAIHAAMVDQVDQNVGRLIRRLKETGEFENTLILFLVDNGASAESPNRKGAPPEPWGSVGTFESIGKKWAVVADTPFRYWKMTSFEGGICTPMIAHWPKGIATEMRGKFYREPCHLIDLLPTWMELAKAESHYPGESKEDAIPPVDGVSITASFSGEPIPRDGLLFFQFGGTRAVRDENWKLIQKRGEKWELYDFKRDRTEANNLAAMYPNRVEQMIQQWNAWYQNCTGRPFVEKVTKRKPKKSNP